MVRTHIAGLLLFVGLTAAAVSPDSTCGGSKAYTCPDRLCCSVHGWCGRDPAYCEAGCQPKFGSCTTITSGSGAPVSQDGICGGTNKVTCSGSAFGDCCSQWNYCGSTGDHCGTGCQNSFGTCGSSSGGAAASQSRSSAAAGGSGGRTSSSTARAAASPSSAVKMSPDGSCGGTNGYTCPSGQCCSKNGYCNTGDDFCGFGCQTAFSPSTCQACPGATCAGTVSGTNPTCWANNNFCWTLSSKKFQITCGRLASGNYLGYVTASSFGDCITQCSTTAGCVAASFYQGGSDTSCSLLSSYQGPAYANSAGGQQYHAYVRGANCG